MSTAEELRDAVNSGKETICVYGKIDLGDISTTGGLSLQENQKLVGVNYFGNYKDGEGFSSISATSSAANNLIDIKKTGCLVSDLSLNYENTATTGSVFVINVQSTNVVADLQNLDITAKFNDTNTNLYSRSAISSLNGAISNIQEKINMKISGALGFGIFTGNKSITNVNFGANLNIETSGRDGIGIYSSNNSITNIHSGANVSIKTTGENGYGIAVINNSIHNLDGNITIITYRNSSYGIFNYFTNNNQTSISSTAQIYLNTTGQVFSNGHNFGQGSNILKIDQGAKIAFEKNGSTKWYEVQKDYKDENTSTTTDNIISADNVETTLNVEQTSSWLTPADIFAAEEAEAEEKAEEEKKNYNTYQNQFNSALSQYDSLIKDSSYKGINLLQEDKLKVNFNEDKSANILVQGVDVTSKALGLLTADWQTGKDVQTSLDQVLSVRNKLRTAASQLGNYYSIITERQTFTENLINVLTEGADKLTLADMNEESANMLSLQTQQNLAVNSLSLASQASQAVLRLF